MNSFSQQLLSYSNTNFILKLQNLNTSTTLLIIDSYFHNRQALKDLNMKKSPLKHSAIKTSIQKELQKPYRPIANIFGTIQEQQEKRNANSIKKILRELTDLKKQLKDIKNFDRNHQQSLDMSVCRKLSQQKKSPSPPQHSHSSSRRKFTSQKKQISTQTKCKKNQINEFSFSIDSKSAKNNRQTFGNNYESDSEQEQPQFSNKKMSVKLTKRMKPSNSNEDLRANENITDRLSALQANQIYQRYLNTLRTHADVIQLSSALYSADDKIKINIQFERLSKNIARIPIYMINPKQYYENLQLYARNINNQINNIILTLNRCTERSTKLKENNLGQINRKTAICKLCDESERKEIDRKYRKQIKRYTKQLSRYQQELQTKVNQEKRIKQIVENLMKQIQKYKQAQIAHKYEEKQWENKAKQLKKAVEKFQKKVYDLEKQRQKQQAKYKILEEDLSFYKKQVEKFKSQYYEQNKDKNRQSKQNYLEMKNKELQIAIAQIRGKQTLYQNILTEKQHAIEELKSKYSIQQQALNMTLKSHNRKIESQDDSINSEQYHRLQHDVREKQNICKLQKQQIIMLHQKNQKLQIINRQIISSMELCKIQIQNLYGEIDTLKNANQKYKDKCLKAKIITEKKGKKLIQKEEHQSQNFKQINQLIRQHRDILAREKK